MGQAKKRGDFEIRKQEALDKRNAELAEYRRIAEEERAQHPEQSVERRRSSASIMAMTALIMGSAMMRRGPGRRR